MLNNDSSNITNKKVRILLTILGNGDKIEPYVIYNDYLELYKLKKIKDKFVVCNFDPNN